MKRILALLLCLMMCVSLIPAAYAEDLEVIDIVDVGDEEPVGEAVPDEEKDLIAVVDTQPATGDEMQASAPVITT